MSRVTCKYDGDNALRELCTFDRESDIEADDCMTCDEYCDAVEAFNGTCSDCAIQKAFDKLAEYEDLEEQGLLKKLGDTVYIIGYKYRHGTYEKWINTGEFKYSDLEKLNKTVFLTKAAAEEALEKIKEGEIRC